MLILDTNVLSTLMSPAPAMEVVAWLNERPEASLFTTAISEAEILAGVAVLPDGRRRQALASAARAMFAEDFQSRVLPFDSAAAAAYSELYAARRQAGRPGAAFDLMIAAIASTRQAAVVTRNTADFESCGVKLINPWTGEAAS